MKPKYKLGQHVYVLRTGTLSTIESMHLTHGNIDEVILSEYGTLYRVTWEQSDVYTEQSIYKSKKALKIAFNQAFEKLNNVGEPF